LAETKNVYWDSCVWIGLINEEDGKASRCQYVVDQARGRAMQIWTSSISLAEVFKKKCEGKNVALEESRDVDFEKYIEQEFLTEVQVDHDIGLLARRLLRRFPELKKPNDAIHLATAMLNNLYEFHTFDEDNLLLLNGKIDRMDGAPLVICIPPEKPIDPQGGLFDGIGN
jgi:predicted nucleic acid-binding protein